MFTDKNKTYNWLKKQATRPPCNYRLVDRLLNERERGNLRSTVRCSRGFDSFRLWKASSEAAAQTDTASRGRFKSPHTKLQFSSSMGWFDGIAD